MYLPPQPANRRTYLRLLLLGLLLGALMFAWAEWGRPRWDAATQQRAALQTAIAPIVTPTAEAGL